MALPAVGLVILYFLGFSVIGPVAGSLAAVFQSVVYGGLTTGLFSILQAFTMAGASWPGVLLLGGCATFGLGYLLWHYVTS
ncbi:hypothetical protein BDN67DRAFT_976337 [Paxillus ammoniavirescens]|nr:hypothetical protein BDN67DRAFT_976337 [Paxillus ammoniavirescens]